MKERIRLSAVSYLNTLPFVYALKKFEKELPGLDVSLDIPAVCGKKVTENKADIGFVPVATIPLIKDAKIISNYCIGAVGEVYSVLLVGKSPLSKIKRIMLDYQSRTSVNLTRVLAKNYWHISPEFIRAEPGFEKSIDKETAIVLIGDRTFDLKREDYIIYDLSEEWQKFTQLPFAFACWVSNKELSRDFLRRFEKVLHYGVNHVADAVDWYEDKLTIDKAMAIKYLTEYISYPFDATKKKALAQFLKFLKPLNIF